MTEDPENESLKVVWKHSRPFQPVVLQFSNPDDREGSAMCPRLLTVNGLRFSPPRLNQTNLGAFILLLRLQEKLKTQLVELPPAWWVKSIQPVLQHTQWVGDLHEVLCEAGIAKAGLSAPTSYLSDEEGGYKAVGNQVLANALNKFVIQFEKADRPLSAVEECDLLIRITQARFFGAGDSGKGRNENLYQEQEGAADELVNNLNVWRDRIAASEKGPLQRAREILEEWESTHNDKKYLAQVDSFEGELKQRRTDVDSVSNASQRLLPEILRRWGREITLEEIADIKKLPGSDHTIRVADRMADECLHRNDLEARCAARFIISHLAHKMTRTLEVCGFSEVEVKGFDMSVRLNRYAQHLDCVAADEKLLMPSSEWLFEDNGSKLFAEIKRCQRDVPFGLIYQWHITPPPPEGLRLTRGIESAVAAAMTKAIKELQGDKRQSDSTMDQNKQLAEIEGSLKAKFENFKLTVPRPVADFTAQGSSLRELHRILDNSANRQFLVHAGLDAGGGVGKTQLVRKFAWDLIAGYDGGPHFLFEDGMVEVNLRAHNYSPVSEEGGKAAKTAALGTSEAMKAVLTALGTEESQVDQLEASGELETFYHARLKERHALVVLDNAVDWNQVAPLLPPDAKQAYNTFFIVTAREKMPRLDRIELATWGYEQIDQYLRQENREQRIFPGHTNAQHRELIERFKKLSGGLPLVVRMVCAFAEHSSGYGSRTALDYFAEEMARKKGAKALPSAIDLCLGLLPEETVQRFESLSIFQVHFDPAAAASVWGMASVGQAAELLQDFVNRGLLMTELSFTAHPDHGQDLSANWLRPAYRMHDLVRQAVSNRLTTRLMQSEINELLRRYVIHYIGRQALQNDLILMKGEREKQFRQRFGGFNVFRLGADWFDRDEFNYDLAFHFCSHRLDESEKNRLLSLMTGVATRAWDLLLSATKRQERIQAGLSAVQELVKSETASPEMADVWKIEEAMHTNSLGLACRHLGQRDDAGRLFDEAFELSSKAGWKWGQACARGNSGNIDQERSASKDAGMLRTALQKHEEARKLSEEVNDQLGLAQDHGNLGIVRIDLWKLDGYSEGFELAAKDFKKRIGIAGFINDRRGAGNGLGNLAYAYLTRYLKYLGGTQSSPKDREEALDAYTQAIEAHEEARNARGVAACRGNRGRMRLILVGLKLAGADDLKSAGDDIRSSLKIFDDVGDLLGQKVAVMHRRSWHLLNDDPKNAAKDMKLVRELETKLKGIPLEVELPRGEEENLPRHLADKYGKLCAIDLESADYKNDSLAQEILKARSLCADYLAAELEFVRKRR
ncbi:MAG: hypothetical protein ACO1TE_24395 [Prosthecobacter sp.]